VINLAVPVAAGLLLTWLIITLLRGGQQGRDVAAHTANRRAGRYCPGRCRWCHDERVDADYSTLIAGGYGEGEAEAETARRYRRGDYGQR
jgi:hypothetical protein